jgi:hypothetical protein
VSEDGTLDLAARAQALLAHPAVTLARPPTNALREDEPPDLSALYAACDGLELADGTRILGREEAACATAWLKDDRSLDWDDELLIVGERDDLVVVRDADRQNVRAGGGVLEAPTDGLASFQRAALDVIGYLEARVGAPATTPRASEEAPERAARGAMTRGDATELAAAIARGFYPGADRELARAAIALGAIHARSGDGARALEAFARAAEARTRSAPRGAEAAAMSASWRAAAMAADEEGAAEVAAACRARAAGGR